MIILHYFGKFVNLYGIDYVSKKVVLLWLFCITGLWYYCNTNGYMVTGKKMIDGKAYTFDASGALVG